MTRVKVYGHIGVAVKIRNYIVMQAFIFLKELICAHIHTG